MSDAITPGTSRVRPTTVTVSSWLLFAVAAIELISFIMVLSVLG